MLRELYPYNPTGYISSFTRLSGYISGLLWIIAYITMLTHPSQNASFRVAADQIYNKDSLTNQNARQIKKGDRE